MNLGRTRICVLFLVFALLTVGSAKVATAADPAREAKQIVADAQSTLANFLADPNLTGVRSVLPRARGVLIIPEQNKGGFIFAGSGGAGVLIARDEKTNKWSAPAFYRMGSASVGFQIGGSRSEVLLLVMTQKALDALLSTSTKLGGQVAVAAGPVGQGEGEIGIDIYSYARSKGLFAGISLEGSVIKPSEDRNSGFYGRHVSPVDILVRRAVEPGAGQALVNAVAAATKR